MFRFFGEFITEIGQYITDVAFPAAPINLTSAADHFKFFLAFWTVH